MDLRVDANEAWTAAEAAATRSRELEPFGITAVEQPVPHAEVDRLAAVRKQVKTPIMLDESLCGMVDAERAAANGLCDLFNLRLSKCGGFIPSLRLAQFAAKHGLGYQLGCQVGETAILSDGGPALRHQRRGPALRRRLVRPAPGARGAGRRGRHLRLGRLGAGDRADRAWASAFRKSASIDWRCARRC